LLVRFGDIALRRFNDHRFTIARLLVRPEDIALRRFNDHRFTIARSTLHQGGYIRR